MRVFKVALCFVSIFQGLVNAQSSNETLSVSQDGSCGATVNQTCQGSSYGNCCSARGYCGGTTDYCNPSGGCQSAFGSCSTSSSVISVDGRCGTQDPLHQICIGSEFGSCCSTNGWCGNGTTYCGQGCQSSSGTCGGTGVTIDTGANATSASPSSSSTSGSSTYTSTAASSTSSSPTTPEALELESTKSSLKATQIGLGVVAAFLGISLIVIVWLAFFRRKRSTHAPAVEHIEKAHTDHEPTPIHSSHAPASPKDLMSTVSEAPPAPFYQRDDNKWSTSKFEAHELGSTDSRAELRGSEKGHL